MPDYATGDTVRYKPIGGELVPVPVPVPFLPHIYSPLLMVA